jgi:predicted glycogen debranching enzyme
MTDLVRKLGWPERDVNNFEPLLTREWLVTNGLGGYASGTIGGAVTRRYHGLLIAALQAPFGRVVMLNHLSERLRLPDGRGIWLGGEERSGGRLELPGAPYLTEFRLEEGMPIWRFEIEEFTLEKRVLLLHQQNTVHITYSIVSGEGLVRLKLRPAVHFRPHEAEVSGVIQSPYTLTACENRLELSKGHDLPALRMLLYGQRGTFTLEGKNIHDIYYRIEAKRGYEDTGDLWSPGYFGMDLAKGLSATVVASTEGWDTIRALKPEEAIAAESERRRGLISLADPKARAGVAADLVLAADQFVITPAGRQEDAARAHAAGDEVRTVIAGYHWFTDWGRDTMISLEGLTLTTGRHLEAGWILRTFAYYVRDGLIPNMFPEGEKEGLYHTADATLWYFQAIHRYLEVTGDRATLLSILPKLKDIVEHHIHGTRFSIRVDPDDGLLRQGEEGYQLTWMDAKCDGWVVTPRRGKAVELNALWYNALRLLEGWIREIEGEGAARSIAAHAERARRSFNERFWYAEGGYLYDVVDTEGGGNDPACRPNQLFSISLHHSILEESRWESVIKVVQDRLLTPVGLRSLSRDHPDYKPNYHGDLRTRDAAYHQGTVWAWLIGPFIDAYVKTYPNDRIGARRFLEGFVSHLNEACIGSISEIFDAEPPYLPGGCVAQAWSVAEVLRCWIKTEE